MNVVHVMPCVERAFGGPVEALFGYVAAATGAGATTTVIAPDSRGADWDWLRDAMPLTHLVPVGGALARGLLAHRAWAAPAMAQAVRSVAREAVVHVHGTLDPVSAAGACAARMAARPVVIGPFGTLSRYTYTHRRQRLKQWYFGSVDAPLLRRSVVHFTSEAERDDAAWHGIDFGDRGFVVPPPWRAPALARRIGARPTVLYLGRLHPVKRVELLLDAWPAVRQRYSDAHLIITGTGDPAYVARLRARGAERGGTTPGITFTGSVDTVERARHLAEAVACVLPSWQESFGMAVLDALGAGVPVVVTPTVALAPFVAREGVGIVARPSAGDWAAAIISVLGDAALQLHTASWAPAAVRREFGATAVAPALVRMYERAAQVARSGGRGGRPA